MAKDTCRNVIKLTCLFLICVQCGLGWTRFAAYYREAQSSKHGNDSDYLYDLFWIIYCIFPTIATLFLPFQMYYLVLEVKTDLILFFSHFVKVYVMFLLMFFMYLYETMGYQLGYYIVTTVTKEPDRTGDIARDIIDGIVGSVSIVLFMLVLFRPLLPGPCKVPSTGDVNSGSSIAYRAHLYETDGQKINHDKDQHVSCGRKVCFAFACLFVLLYVGEFIAAVTFMVYNV